MKITSPTMSARDAIVELSEGNPGAINVMVQLCKKSPICLLALDIKGIYGPAIWTFYKDRCGQDIEKMIAELTTQGVTHAEERPRTSPT